MHFLSLNKKFIYWVKYRNLARSLVKKMWNQIKTVLLLGILTAILLGVGYLIGGITGLLVGLIFSLLINFFTFFFSDKFVLAIYQAKPADEKKYSWLHADVAEIAKVAGVPKPRVYITPMNISNAFATGRNPKNAVVAVTEGILQNLSRKELKGVLAHEIGHVKNRDILIATVAATIAGVISYLAYMAQFAAFFGGGRSDDDGEGGRMNILGLIVAAIVAPIAAMLIQMAISRSREFLADEAGARFLKDPLPLANALLKLESESKKNPLKKGNHATAHLFIVNPFSAQGFAKLFSTHPPMSERVARLKGMKF